MYRMLRSVWDYFLELDPTLAAAIIAAAVAVLTSVVAVLFTPVGSYLVATRQLRDRLKTEYEYEQRKKLRDLIGRYHGRVLQAAEEMNYRIWILYRYEDQNWLEVGNDYCAASHPDNYFFQTTVHRFLVLFTVIWRFLTEAIYVDSRIAEKSDFEFTKYLRTLVWIVNTARLFHELPYDVSKATDHFLRDDLKRVCDSCWVREEEGEGRVISLEELRGRMGRDEVLNSTLDFFSGLRADESRYRWDRVVALHLILIAFMNDFGYEFQRSPGERMDEVVSKFRRPEVPQNLLTELPRMGLTEGNIVRVRQALEKVTKKQ